MKYNWIGIYQSSILGRAIKFNHKENLFTGYGTTPELPFGQPKTTGTLPHSQPALSPLRPILPHLSRRTFLLT